MFTESAAFWTEPLMWGTAFGGLLLTALAIFLILKSETGQEIVFWFEGKAELAAYKRFVKKYQAPEHFTHPHRKDLQRFYATREQECVYDTALRKEFNILPSNAYYRFLDRKNPFVEIFSATEWVKNLQYMWEDKLEILKSYADQGYNAARVALYYIYYYGVKKDGDKDCIEKNEKLAMQYLNVAVKGGYVHAQEQLVWMAQEEKDYEKAEKLIEKYGLQGTHVYYMYWGEAYYYGYGVSVDYKKALAYFEKANLWKYTIQMRVCCLEQLRRFGEAMAICRDLMKMNDSWGTARYSAILSNEFGKHKKAFRIVKRAHKKGDNTDDILFRLAYSYAKGYGCKKDAARAIELYRILADRDVVVAVNNLAAIYSKDAAYEAKDVFALYLKAAWSKPFQERNTTKKRFTTEKGEEIEVPMMMMRYSEQFYKDDVVAMVSKRLQGGYSMLFILPGEGVKCDEAAEYVAKNFDTLLKNMEITDVNLSLPKFTTDFGMSLKNTLASLGIKRAFEGKAQLGGISDEALYISDVVQKTYINVNEKGTEAAAVTMAVAGLLSMRPSKIEVITFDRPFIYAIIKDNGNQVMFAGKVGNPNEK
jgi:TPR repeat protein